MSPTARRTISMTAPLHEVLLLESGGGVAMCNNFRQLLFLDVPTRDSTDRHTIVRASALSGSVEQRFPIEKRMKP
jgi:hypothetical protein